MMDWGFTIPLDHVRDFLAGKSLRLRTGREITIIWDKKKYKARLSHVKRTKASPVYQIRWDNNRALLNKIRRTFIQSYVIIKSQKELFDISKTQREHFRTALSGGQQEVAIFTPVNTRIVKCKVFIQIDSGWNKLFSRLADENVFGWLFEKGKKYLITKSTNWLRKKEFKHHAFTTNVIYYLSHTKKKLLYIGKAEVLGKRVKPGLLHQRMPGDWDKFKYDVIKPEYSNLLERIEDHTIRVFASVLKNRKNYPSLEVGDYALVNSNWKKL